MSRLEYYVRHRKRKSRSCMLMNKLLLLQEHLKNGVAGGLSGVLAPEDYAVCLRCA